MKHMKKLLLVSMVSAASNALAAPVVLPTALTDQLIVAETYSSLGALAVVHGNIQTGTYTSVGAGTTGTAVGGIATVHGSVNSGTYTSTGNAAIVDDDITAGGYVSVGAFSEIGGSIESGGYTSTGASAVVTGTVDHVGYFTQGAGAVTGTVTQVGSVTPPAASLQATIMAEQAALKALTGTGTTTYATGGASTFGPAGATFNAGVHDVDDILSFAASTTITLAGNGSTDDQHWVFNVGNYMVLGANVDVVITGAGPNSTVTWNILGDSTGVSPSTLGYASLGAGVDFIGTILANAYISVGAGSAMVSGVGDACGGLYSAQSYVSVGATSIVGGDGCTSGPSAVPISAAAWLFGSALFGLVGVARRKKA